MSFWTWFRYGALCFWLLVCLAVWGGEGTAAARLALSEPAARQLLEVDLLYLTRNEGDHHRQALELLKTLGETYPELRDEVLWRQSRSEKWLGDQAHGTAERLRHYELAKGLAAQGVGLNKHCVECHFWLGVAYGKIGVERGVLKSLFLVKPIMDEMNTVLSMDPKHSGAHHVRGVVYRLIPWFAGGSMEKSISELELAVQLNKASTVSYIELARSYAEAGKVDKGIDTLDALEQVTAPFDPTQAKVDRQHAAELRRELSRS